MLVWIQQKKGLVLFLAVTLGIGGWLTFVLRSAEDKSALLPGVTTHGHYQIELQCAACHDNEKKGNVFTSSGVSNAACTKCHGEDLTAFGDSHPVRKFKNPENAIFLKHVDAKSCVACHSEHNEKLTQKMGVTIPQDYCAHCHEVTLESLESHKNLAFTTCATAGCHNYHDNVALAPSYLLKHFGEPDILPEPLVAKADALSRWLGDGNKPREQVQLAQADAPEEFSGFEEVDHQWSTSAHAKAGINCSDCHGSESAGNWVSKPGLESCRSCHESETATFLKGKHGMRLVHENLSPMKPEMARQVMHPEVGHHSLSCNSCHQAHQYDREFASTGACLQCHSDTHSKNYENSAHARLWQAELSGAAPEGTGVSCATCHMPTVKDGERVLVSHDQTANLKPNEKMIRSVCSNCHGLQFTMDALSDPALIESNFIGRPAETHPGIGWTVESVLEKGGDRADELKAYIRTLSDESKPIQPTNSNHNHKKKENDNP